MPKLKSLDELRRLREKAQHELSIRQQTTTRITVGMGTCGIAAGARDTMTAVLAELEKRGISDVVVTQTGCIGLCEYEPIVQVQVGNDEMVTYGHIDSARVPTLVEQHVVEGKPIEDWLVKK